MAKFHGGHDSPFDVADTYLEAAQGLCETAAHHFLRHGDCAVELDKTKQKLDLALNMAKAEVERLKEEAKIEEEAEAEAKEKERAKAKALEEEKQREAERLSVVEQKLEKAHQKDLEGAANAIEVDDASDTSSISIDITAFRSSRFRR